MNETQKPFSCSEKGCEMTFTNEDHLNWHQKKHMILNLGLAKNNDVADQTPTPTRFIRNCEEVGLFQDLQNVNPFDEIFKKAVEVAKTGGTLEVPEANSDDTLHTPHILPHIEENKKKNSTNNQDDNNSQSNDFSLNNVISITITEDDIGDNSSKDSTSVIVIDDDSTEKNDVKAKIKEALQNKEKQKVEKENSAVGFNAITLVPFQNLVVTKETTKNVAQKEKDIDDVFYETVSDSSDTIEKKREMNRKEMNRAAQIRCRKRKQIRWKEMEEELISLSQENKKLKIENYNLRCELMKIKENALNASNDTEPLQATIIGTLTPVVENQKTMEKDPPSTSSNTTNPHISPKKTNSPTTPNPVVIHIINVPNSVVPVAETLQPNSSDSSKRKIDAPSKPSLHNAPYQEKVKKKNFRKIIPKIIIEN